MKEHRFDDSSELARRLAESIAGDLAAAVDSRGAASLVVSGGSTPRPLFDELSRRPLAWEQVSVTLADERWVAADHEASNEALVRRHLLTEEASEARWVGLTDSSETPEDGCDEIEGRLRSVPRPFDVVVLGMGGDGHTASLFPGAAELADGLDPANERLCLAVRPPEAPYPRLSLTLAALLASRRIVLHVTGQQKWAVYQQALADGPAEELPIRAVLRGAEDRVEVFWAP